MPSSREMPALAMRIVAAPEVDRRREEHREQHQRQDGREDEGAGECRRPRLAEDHQVAGDHHHHDEAGRGLPHGAVPAKSADAHQQNLAQQQNEPGRERRGVDVDDRLEGRRAEPEPEVVGRREPGGDDRDGGQPDEWKEDPIERGYDTSMHGDLLCRVNAARGARARDRP